ncbi:RluA family pseudouridine synthase [Treponema socranskii subsp. buccale]|uniref:RluA family pseudouridine synthase n=1 Tax=Treponema socranskii TaxID=53419 RepID=UPI0020A48D8C|nr:RluA family pseudouridine synthase [Treponema socranskii]UTD02307.1 RluA family pseudouridine synthase [Treponema socranskii subsp. buccale]
MNAIPIVYENEEIIIINKPAGVSVQGGEGIAHPLDKELPEQTGYEIFLVHRLDKDTSGLMIAAKTKAAAAKWSKLVASRAVKKEYDAICIGTFAERKGVIRDDVMQHGEIKRAVTQYAVSDIFEIDCGGETLSLSLVHLTLETGRMHQIRIHLAKKGCPVAFDDKHGNFGKNKLLKKYCGTKRLLLCASKLSFPLSGKEKIVRIELPKAFGAILNDVRKI